MSLNDLVLALNIAGASIASLAIVPLQKVVSLNRAPALRRAWRGLTLVMVFCIGLLLAAAAASIHKTLDGFDFAATGIHVLGPCFVLGVAWLSHRTARDILKMESLEQVAFTDALTGLANRRRFDERLADEVRRARQICLPLSLLVLDIDHFKRVNDTFGHSVGDLVLKQVATLIVAKTRHLDTACRVGGEEFVVIAPGVESVSAAAWAERLRQAIADTVILLENGGEVWATVSIGLATLCPSDTADMLFRRADAALYTAKRGGRDRVSRTS